MAIASTLKHYLDERGVDYELVSHPHTGASMWTAAAAHVPGDKVAKGVVLRDERGYLMAVLPATHHLDLDSLNSQTHRHLDLVPESELGDVFNDCEYGAVPPVGAAYHMDVAMDMSLEMCPDLYFEAGDHNLLVHLDRDTFRRLQGRSDRGTFSHHD